MDDDDILKAAKEIRQRRYDEMRANQTKKLIEASRGNVDLNICEKYPVILVDPPWRYFSTTMDRDVENHYPTMTIEEIMAMPVSDLATETAVLFLCATNPLLPQCLQVMQKWGFDYKTNVAWDKDRQGLGFYVRAQHELILIGARGESMIPITKNRPPSVIRSRREEHSKKPALLYRMIEDMFPGLPKIELFARVQRPGWGCWGNEVKRGNFLRFKN